MAKREVDPVYVEAERLYCAERSAVFASRGAAEKHREKAMAKARAAYHKGQCK